ncbi:hypothetical protein ABZ746_00360 [Streptomyces sp. NPDC020096]
MRTLMTIQIDAEAGTQALESGTMRETLQHLADRTRPEAAYFFSLDGMRTALFVFDLDDPSQLPALTEPAFRELKARVSLYPVMSLDDLLTGLARLH